MNYTDSGLQETEQLRTIRDKLDTLFHSKTALSITDFDRVDLNEYREWLFKVVKKTNKLKDTLQFDFFSEMNNLRQKQGMLDEVLQKASGLEHENEILKGQTSELVNELQYAQASIKQLQREEDES